MQQLSTPELTRKHFFLQKEKVYLAWKESVPYRLLVHCKTRKFKALQ
jgi:hypothetical protein